MMDNILLIILYLIPTIVTNVCFKFISKLWFIWFNMLLLIPLFNYAILLYLFIDANSHDYFNKKSCIFKYSILRIMCRIKNSEFTKWLIKEEW